MSDAAVWKSYAEALAEQIAREDLSPGMIGVHRWYLRRPPQPVAPPEWEDGYAVQTSQTPPTAWARLMYRLVGEDWLWYERLRLSDQALSALYAEPGRSFSVLYADGAPMGFFELDRRDPEAVDLAYFGLTPWAIGQGIGARLLAAAIIEAGGDATKMTVNTCTLDHPKALATYQRAGFVIEREIQFDDPDPRLFGSSPRAARPDIPLARR